MLPIHPAFVQIKPLSVDLNRITWDIKGIDILLNEIIEKAGITRTGGIVTSQESNQVDLPQYSDILTLDVFKLIAGNQISAIAGGIAGGIANKFIWVLEIASAAKSRKEILNKLNLVNNANNFETYIQPLVTINWLTMTIPHKPTSPKQQYLSTLKGRLILRFLKSKMDKTVGSHN